MISRISRRLCALPGDLPANLSGDQVRDLCNTHTLYSWQAQKPVPRIHIKSAKGATFTDVNGKEYLDMNAQLMCSNIGHGNPDVISAIQKQAEELVYVSSSHICDARARAANRMQAVMPKELSKYFFVLGGADANENAIKIARQYTGRHKILARWRSYHGAVGMAMQCTGDSRRWPNEPAASGVVRLSDAYAYRSRLYRPEDGEAAEANFTGRLLEELEETIRFEGAGNIAAVFMETVVGTNGLIVPPAGYLEGVREITRRYDILLILDEVMAGMGRCGSYTAAERFNVVPDMLVLAKGLTSAYQPLGCVALTPTIASAFDEKVLSCGMTYHCHPMSMAACDATIRVMQRDRICEDVRAREGAFNARFQRLKERHAMVGDVRSIGFFGAAELVRNRETKEPLVPYLEPNPILTFILSSLRDRGIVTFGYYTYLFANPPLVITEDELDRCFAAYDEVLTEAAKML